jgi:hypothetical protein
MARKQPKPPQAPNSGSEEVPPGATRQATDWYDPPTDSDAGPRHAAADEGNPNEDYGGTDSNEPLADQDREPEEESPTAYAGHAGGAVGGTPAGLRSSEGHEGDCRGFAPDRARPTDSTIGADPGK